MTQTMRYCRNCQQRFSVAPESPGCPQCGEALESWAEGPTLDLQTVSLADTTDAASDAEPPEALVGQQLAQYQIERFLGQGGMARVYRARHLTLERPCAIKVLRPRGRTPIDDVWGSFLAEARAAAALVHPHVVTLHTIGIDRERHYIEMEYVDGQSLAEVGKAAGCLEPLEATRYMLQISSALALAHRLGMVHRDIKPANVMVTSAGDAKLADFGLAKRLVTSSQGSANVLSGTPSFMAPELFNGLPASRASDIYAMGVSYFSLLTGRLPVDAKSLSELVAYHAASYAGVDWEHAASGLPAGVVEILRRCLARRPEDRYADASVLFDALQNVFGSLRSLQSLLGSAFLGAAFPISGSGSHFEIRVPLDEGRSQTVHVEAIEDAETREGIIRVYSVCGRAAAEHFERALRLNAAVSHGAIGIEEMGGAAHFVMVNTYPRATCDAEEIRQSVLEIARHSDAVERLLGGDDRH